MARTTRPAASSSASTPQIHSAFFSCTDPGSAPDAPHDVPVGAGDDLQVHPVLLVLAGLERPVGGEPADRDERAVEDDVSVPSPSSRLGPRRGASIHRLRSLITAPRVRGSRWPSCTACNADSCTAADHIETTRLARPCLVHKGSQCTFTLSCSKADKAIGTQPLSQL